MGYIFVKRLIFFNSVHYDEIQLKIHTFSYLSLTLSYLSFKNKVDLDGFQIKSKSNPNQYTPPGFGKSTKSNTLKKNKLFFSKTRNFQSIAGCL